MSSSQQQPPQPPSQRPSLRLNLSAAAAAAAAAGKQQQKQQTAGIPLSKKRKVYTPASLPLHTASAAQLTVLHQVTRLNLVLLNNTWYIQGTSTLYLINNNSSSSNVGPSQLALHLRSSCHVTSLSIETPVLTKMVPLSSEYKHADPLHHVLLRPPSTFTVSEDDNMNKTKLDADAQSSRGAAGMTTALRAASMASNMGELRITYQAPSSPPSSSSSSTTDSRTTSTATETLTSSSKSSINNTASSSSTAATANTATASMSNNSSHRLVEVVWKCDLLSHPFLERHQERRKKRVDYCAQQLALAGTNALKVIVTYKIPLNSKSINLGGLHVRTSTVATNTASSSSNHSNPHVYTTCGVFGDHEGPRCWFPCVDSAATNHRATHQLFVTLTAQMTRGLSIVAAGDDAGSGDSYLHLPLVNNNDTNSNTLAEEIAAARKVLGSDHVDFLLMTQLLSQQQLQLSASHIIPDVVGGAVVPTLDMIQTTVVYQSATWSPVPARAMGFAVGPFSVLEDAEYFACDEDGDSERFQQLQQARKDGHGIRQLYFCPIFERKFVHVHADQTLLAVDVVPLPLNSRQIELREQLKALVHVSTVGVPYRALKLMRDVLAFPTFRTWSHTQVWIPDCHHGGTTSGCLHTCPEVSVNAFLGVSILDSRLLPPIGSRLPYYQGGRVLQFVQARAAIRGWIIAALPLGGNDDVANGYIHSVVESFLMSVYERGHGAHGEGGAKGGVFFSKRYSVTSGLNSANLDFLPVQNIEDMDTVIGGVGAVPIEERHNEQLWRSATNGSESHTSAIDEFNVRQLLCRDAVEALERVSEKDKNVPLPSIGWFGSHLSLTFLSSNATSSSDLGCGAVELLHPVGGLVYRALKSEIFRSIVEGRAGVAVFIRLIRAALLAAHLGDIGDSELRLPTRREKKSTDSGSTKAPADSQDVQPPKPPFVVCVNEILKKKGLTHTLFTRALQNLSGPLKEAHLLGTLVDVEPNEIDPRTRRPLVDPEGFPNSYVRGSSLLYCRVGVQVEFGDGGAVQAQSSVAKGISMQAYAEPIIPEGGIAYGGPITMRVIENEGQFREYVKELLADGSRRDWGSTFLHAKSVSTVKAQTAASGTIEGSKDAPKTPGQEVGASYPSLQSKCATRAFTDTNFHRAGYQAIELIRLTNLTPLLWVRVDPLGLYSGRISVFQPDPCLAECLFHDGDAGAQVEAIRALAERPLRIQPTTKVTAIYDVNVLELPVRVLADCLRGSPALHSSLPHTPAVRCQAALAIAQWQNNKAPPTKDSVGLDSWVGANLLIQYFRERFYSNGVVMPVKFSRLCLRKSEAEVAASAAAASESGAANPKHDENFEYLDSLEEGEERAEKAAAAASIEMEEDEEYRVRAAVVNAISSIRAKDGQTPPFVLQFLETVLEAEDAEMVSHLVYPDEELMLEKSLQQMKSRASGFDNDSDEEEDDHELSPSLSFVSGKLVADALLSLCNINASPTMILDPKSGKLIQSSGRHPVTRLMKVARSWLDWELYREKIRGELAAETESGLSGNCHNLTAAAAILALANLSIMKQSTSDPPEESTRDDAPTDVAAQSSIDEVATVQFYVSIFDMEPLRNDNTRAACAQAIACICCAADRFQKDTAKSVGLLTALELLLDRILDARTSSSLRQTLALIMMDACTGKVCSSQRVGAIAGQNDLIASTARFLTGPLGASHGGDNGSAILTTVSAVTFPAANAVNEGARRGRRLVGRAGHPKEAVDRSTIVRVARFATRLWRTINGDPPEPPIGYQGEAVTGICAFDGALRCSLLALWQLIWPRGCFSVLQVQDWKSQEKTKQYAELGAHLVMQISEEEKAAAASEETSLGDINRFVEMELNRQAWRGEMAKKAYEMYKATKGSTAMQDVAAAEQGIGQPLPPIQRDAAFKQGGWIASAAQQRRALALDGGTAVTKLRLTVKTNQSDA